MKTRYFISIGLIALLLIVGCSKEEKEVNFDPNEMLGVYEISLTCSSNEGDTCPTFTQRGEITISKLDDSTFSFSIDSLVSDSIPELKFRLVPPFSIVESYFIRKTAHIELIDNQIFSHAGDNNYIYYLDATYEFDIGAGIYLKIRYNDPNNPYLLLLFGDRYY